MIWVNVGVELMRPCGLSAWKKMSGLEACPYRKHHPDWLEREDGVLSFAMIASLRLLTYFVVSLFRSKGRLEAEIVVLRHQLNILRRRMPSRARLTLIDRLIFIWLYRLRPVRAECRCHRPARHRG